MLNVYGHLRVQDDPVWLRGFLEKLTAQQEANFAKPCQNKVIPEYQGVIAGLKGIQVADAMALASVMQSLKPAH